jgi:RNA polymerase sigma-70 factor (ECF subfamily)
LQLFHSGDRAILEACYRDHFANTERAVGTILGSADRETVIHELFSRLIAQPELRRSFQGGSFGAWIATIARNQAIDYRRRLGRETATAIEADATAVTENWEQAAEAHMLVERFRRDHLPPQWQGVFELRFLRQLPQREAAAQLSMHRTTLAYRELRIRHLLRRFLLEGDEP